MSSKRPTKFRFSCKSARHPPDKLVPRHVLDKCKHVRRLIFSIIGKCNSCFPADNLSTNERFELNRLKHDPSVVITPVDKGGKWFIVSLDEYLDEAFRQLADNNFYVPVETSPANVVSKKLNNYLSYLRRKHFVSTRELKALTPPTVPKERKFYMLPKVHKTEWPTNFMPPGRPIVSDCRSVSRNCASFIEYFLAPIAKSLPSYVRDSYHVISILKNFKLKNNSIMFTLDVSSLYTSIPTDRGIEACGRAFLKHSDPNRPDLTILSMLRLLLRSNDFLFHGERFLQTHGTAMGCAFGGSYASIYLSEWEECALQFPKSPSLWIRYIDDVFAVWDHSLDDLYCFRDAVNTLDVNISVNLSYDLYSIRFLDLELYRCKDLIFHRVGFKPTDSFTLLSTDSYHPCHIFKSIIYCQLYRFVTHCSTYDDFKMCKKVVQGHWRRQGYSRSLIRSTVRKVLTFTNRSPVDWDPGFFPCVPTSNCRFCCFASLTFSVADGLNTFPILHRLSCKSENVIYLITCKRCNMRYVGETSRALCHRISEHLYNIRSGQPTAVADHFRRHCSIRDFSFIGIEYCTETSKRRIKEQKWIKRLRTLSPNGINVLGESRGVLHLVLPHSNCSNRIVRACRSVLHDVRTIGSFRTHPNIRTLLSGNH